MNGERGIVIVVSTLLLIGCFTVFALPTKSNTLSVNNNPVKIYDWYDLDDVRNNLDGNYVLMSNLNEDTTGYEEYNAQKENYVDEEEAGSSYEETWSKGDTIDIIFDDEQYDSILSVENKTGTAISHTVGEETITINEDTGDKYVYVTYENAVVGWNPIGDFDRDDDVAFKGKFNGNGHKITDLYINRPITNYVGLFGHSKEAQIVDLGLIDIVVNANRHVGGLVGESWGGIIKNSFATGKVRGNQFVGGLTGNNYYGTVNNSYAACDVIGSYAGGLVGENSNHENDLAIVNNSYSTGNLSGEGTVGGLVGDNEALIKSSYATGDVSGKDMIGGLAGRNMGLIENSHATGDVNGEGLVGGLVGLNDNVINNSYANGDVYGRGDVGGLVGQIYRGTVNNSHATGNVTGVRDVGVLVGKIHVGTVNNSYATGEVNRKSTPGFTGTLLMLSAIIAIAIYRKKR